MTNEEAYKIAYKFSSLNQYPQVIDFVTKFEKETVLSNDLAALGATSFIRNGQYKDALKWLNKYLDIYPNDLDLMISRARAFQYLGDPKAYRNEINDMLRIAPDHHTAQLALADLHVLDKQYLKALAVLEKIRGTQKDLPTETRLSEVYSLLGRYNEAETIARVILGKVPNSWINLIRLAQILAKKRNYKEAIHYAELAREIMPNERYIVMFLFICFLFSWQWKKAFATIRSGWHTL